MIEGSMFVLLSGALTFGVPLLIGAHELLTMKPGGGGGGHDPVPEVVPPAPTPRLGDAPMPPKKLPDCLIPNLPPLPASRPARELEPV